MEIGAVLFILGLLALVAAFVGRPLLEQRGLSVSEEDIEFSSLLAQRDRILDALEELDMDQAMNKVDPEDYQERRAQLVSQGAEVLRQLDAMSPGEERVRRESAESIEGSIEAEVIRLRKSRTKQTETQYCPACGSEALLEDRFCTQCGEPLVESVSS
jgi:hypothetical protein